MTDAVCAPLRWFARSIYEGLHRFCGASRWRTTQLAFGAAIAAAVHECATASSVTGALGLSALETFGLSLYASFLVRKERQALATTTGGRKVRRTISAVDGFFWLALSFNFVRSTLGFSAQVPHPLWWLLLAEAIQECDDDDSGLPFVQRTWSKLRALTGRLAPIPSPS